MLSHFSHVQLFVTPWTVACQAPLSIRFFRQEYWGGLSCPPPGDLSDPGIKHMSLMFPALADRFFPLVPTHYSDIKMNEIMPFAATLMGLEYIMLSQTEKDTYHDSTYMWNLKIKRYK